MPNQRKKGKEMIGVYVDQDMHDRLTKDAKRRGMTLADLVRSLFAEYLKTR